MDKPKKKDVDALALKRKLSKRFFEQYFKKDGTFNYEKLKATEKKLGLREKANNPG